MLALSPPKSRSAFPELLSTYAVEAAFVELSFADCVATVNTALVASTLALKVAFPVIVIAVEETVKSNSRHRSCRSCN